MLAALFCFILYALAAFYSFSDDKPLYGAFSFYSRKNACSVFLFYTLCTCDVFAFVYRFFRRNRYNVLLQPKNGGQADLTPA